MPSEPSPYKLYLHRAMKGIQINWIGLEMVQQIAAQADPLYDVMVAVRSGRFDQLLPKLPDAATWHGLYRDHQAITRGVGNTLPDLLGMDGDSSQSVLDEVRDLSRRERNNPGEVSSEILHQAKPHKISQLIRIGYRQCERDYKQHLIELRQFLRDPSTVQTYSFETALRDGPAVYFFARVVLPAIVLWQTTPQRLLRQARSDARPDRRSGAIERLVRLDPLALRLDEVMDWQNVDDGSIRQVRQQQLLHWREQGLDQRRFERPHFKVMMGGLIQATAMQIGRYYDWRGKCHDVKMNAPQIKELFHAAARDRAGRHSGVYDEDVEQMQADSWSRSLRNSRQFWAQLIPEIPGSN